MGGSLLGIEERAAMFRQVQQRFGNPIANASLSLAGLSSVSDVPGHFESSSLERNLEQEMDLQAVAPGYKAQRIQSRFPTRNEIAVIFQALAREQRFKTKEPAG